jgi:hypothetical protein
MFATWHEIEHARSPYLVVLLVREYVASIPPHELARVPEQCRPGRLLDESDITRCSGRLTEEYWQLRGTATDVGVLQELWSFFLRASIQLARLREQADVRE